MTLSNFRTDGSRTTAFFDTDDVTEVNLLRRSMMTEIPTYAIEYAIIDINTTDRQDEILALRLAQLVIDHDRFTFEGDDHRYSIDFTGPGTLTSSHVRGLPFKYETPIAELRRNQRFKCDVIVRQGTGKLHVKWRPLSTFMSRKIVGISNIDVVSLPPKTDAQKLLKKLRSLQIDSSDASHIHLDLKGPLLVTTDQIPHLTFLKKKTLVDLKARQKLVLDLTISSGYDLTIKSIGMMSGQQIFEEGHRLMGEAAKWQPNTFFTRLVVPSAYK